MLLECMHHNPFISKYLYNNPASYGVIQKERR